MSFQEHLQQTVERTEGAFACLLMGRDGLPVDSYQHPQAPLDAQHLGVELTGVLDSFSAVTQQANVGEPFEILLHSERFIILFRFLSPDYFLLLALSPEGNVGKARYLLRVLSPALLSELAA